MARAARDRPCSPPPGPVIPNFAAAELQLRRPQPPVLHRLGQRTTGAPVLWPALRQHILLTLVAVAIGFVIALALALARPPPPLARAPDDRRSRPSSTRSPRWPCSSCSSRRSAPNVIAAEIALVSYTLLILFRNILTGLREVPAEVREAARGHGHDPPPDAAARRAAARAAGDRRRPADRDRHDHRARDDRLRRSTTRASACRSTPRSARGPSRPS